MQQFQDIFQETFLEIFRNDEFTLTWKISGVNLVTTHPIDCPLTCMLYPRFEIQSMHTSVFLFPLNPVWKMMTVETTTRIKAHRKTVRRKKLKTRTKNRTSPRKRWANAHVFNQLCRIIMFKSDSSSFPCSPHGLRYSLVFCRWWCQGQESTLFNITTPFGTPDAPQGDQPVLRATNRILSRSVASHRYVYPHDLLREV